MKTCRQIEQEIAEVKKISQQIRLTKKMIEESKSGQPTPLKDKKESNSKKR